MNGTWLVLPAGDPRKGLRGSTGWFPARRSGVTLPLPGMFNSVLLPAGAP
jgi:hypothetical protein